MRYILPVVLMSLMTLSCSEPKKENSEVKEEGVTVVNNSHHSETIAKVFDAHGGYEAWSAHGQLAFTLAEEKQLINLKNRNTLITSPKRTIGFDGQDVWVTPDSVDASRARFYHNLFFYFYAMPFVVGDPGASYEDVQPKELDGKTYGGVKVSYGEGVGDSPKDYYIIWYDPETYKMEWLMYTVTYGKEESSDSYSLIRYNSWNEVSDLALPTSLQWYKYDNEEVGEMRSERQFEEISLSIDEPSDDLFTMPEGAQISPAPETGED